MHEQRENPGMKKAKKKEFSVDLGYASTPGGGLAEQNQSRFFFFFIFLSFLFSFFIFSTFFLSCQLSIWEEIEF